MKKYLLPFIVSAIVSGCGSNDKGESDSKINLDALKSNPAYIKGHELVEKYQCETCHKVDEDLTGPAHAKVAKNIREPMKQPEMSWQKNYRRWQRGMGYRTYDATSECVAGRCKGDSRLYFITSIKICMKKLITFSLILFVFINGCSTSKKVLHLQKHQPRR